MHGEYQCGYCCPIAQMPDFFHRIEVRDITGQCHSILFSPDQQLDYWQLKIGSTVFVRYAAKAYFSDLMTQVGRSM